MPSIALISDIHGNLPALQAVLSDIKNRGISRIFCLGDLVGKGPSGAEVIDVCRNVCEKIIKGNWDLIVTEKHNRSDLTWQRRQLGAERLNYLVQLPHIIEFRLSGKNVRLYHANQADIITHVLHDAPNARLIAMFLNTNFTGYNFEPDIVGYADIHYPYKKTLDQKVLFNIGSVGNPLDKPLACYCIIEGSDENETYIPLNTRVVRLPYDIELAIKHAEDAQMPFIEPYTIELKTSKYSSSMRTDGT